MTDRERLKSLLDRFDLAIAVIGDFMLDEYIWGRVNRISPESPVPVVEFESESAALGGAGNVAANIRSLGGRPIPFGFVGEDAAARKILDTLQHDLGAPTAHMVADSSRPTTLKRRVIAHHQQLLRIDTESTAPAAQPLQDCLLDGLRSAISDVRAVVISDYNKGAVTRPLFEKIMHVALGARVPTILDPKVFDLADVGPVTVITPNEKEAERYSGCHIDGDAAVETAGQRLLERSGAEHVLITRGERGMSIFSRDASPVHMPTQAREVSDVTGAGDTVVSAVALALAAGATLVEAAWLANLAAGVVVGKVGTAAVTREELQSALSGDWPAAVKRGVSR